MVLGLSAWSETTWENAPVPLEASIKEIHSRLAVKRSTAWKTTTAQLTSIAIDYPTPVWMFVSLTFVERMLFAWLTNTNTLANVHHRLFHCQHQKSNVSKISMETSVPKANVKPSAFITNIVEMVKPVRMEFASMVALLTLTAQLRSSALMSVAKILVLLPVDPIHCVNKAEMEEAFVNVLEDLQVYQLPSKDVSEFPMDVLPIVLMGKNAIKDIVCQTVRTMEIVPEENNVKVECVLNFAILTRTVFKEKFALTNSVILDVESTLIVKKVNSVQMANVLVRQDISAHLLDVKILMNAKTTFAQLPCNVQTLLALTLANVLPICLMMVKEAVKRQTIVLMILSVQANWLA